MRFVAFDIGRKRTGVAVSDASGTLATPLRTLHHERVRVSHLLAIIRELEAQDDGLDGVVVGLPRRLDGRDTEMTGTVRQLVAELARHTRLPVAVVDERLSSVEAETRLSGQTRDWRERKSRLDAAAAAVILQEFLDMRSTPTEEPHG